MTSKQINKEVNRECADTTANDQAQVMEKFFNVKRQEPFSNADGATTQSISDYTPEHVALLDIQTKLFNNILRNNLNKYGGYISVDDIPKGAPIEVLDTVCVGGVGITGNEDSEECVGKGGRISKIKNKTTKIKLELISNEESQIDKVSQSDLYYPKDNKKVPLGTVPINVANYNASIKANGTILPNVPQTTGITYNLGDSSNNTVGATMPITTATATATTQPPMITKAEHPDMLEEDDTVVRKCKRDAIDNAIRVAQITTPLIASKEAFTNAGAETFVSKYKIPIIILVVIILLLLGYITMM